MGKTSFARVLADRLREEDPRSEVICWPFMPVSDDEFLAKLGRDLNFEFSGRLFVDELVEAVNLRGSGRTILIFDEVDDLIGRAQGRSLLENMRIAWEQLEGRLGVVILGGSSLYELLETNVSPFLRSAEFVPAARAGPRRGSASRPRALPHRCSRCDSRVAVAGDRGAPALLTEIMKAAVDGGGDVAAKIFDVIDVGFAEALETKYFAIWWRNLRCQGQALYRRLVEHGAPIERARVASLSAGPASTWVSVLETTGVARIEAGELLPRGELFGRWARREHFVEREIEVSLATHLEPIAERMSEFERELSVAISRWRNGVIGYAGLGLLLKPDKADKRGKGESGNDRLMPEAHFQLSLLLALAQHGWQVEAEGWSVTGRSDLKVQRGAGGRTCIELKIWGRNAYQSTTEQVVSYALPTDEFASVVMIDRQLDSLFSRYSKLLTAGSHRIIARAQPATAAGAGPHFVTEHTRATGQPLRVHHYLVQLPGDRTV